MIDHHKLREAIHRLRVSAPAKVADIALVCLAAESTLPKTRTASVYLIIGTSRATGKVCVAEPIYGAGNPTMQVMQDNFALSCDDVRMLGPFPQEVPE